MEIVSLFPCDPSFLMHNGKLWDINKFTHTSIHKHIAYIKINFIAKIQILVSTDTTYHRNEKRKLIVTAIHASDTSAEKVII